jgi:short-subunit dehydrogenase
MKLQGKTVLITGASAGIGAACMEAFRHRGANVSGVARSHETLEQAAGNGSLVTAGDLTDPDVRQQCVDRTLERFGSIDVLVNNAGVGLYVPSWRAGEAETRAMLELNLFVPMAMTRLVAPQMVERRSGMIVNVGSIAGKVTLPWMTIYSASKYALGSLTDGLRIELKDTGVKAMTVCPGYVKTGFHSHMLGGEIPLSIQRSKKFAITPEQCAADIVAGVEREKRTVMSPKVGWLLVALARLFPGVVDARLHRMYRSAENG